jgi:TfoX/Sxy family transcriptional regulator of competence genes
VSTHEAKFDAMVAALLDEPDVTPPGAGDGRRSFGSAGLKVRGRIFAMLSRGRLVVKLSRERVDALVAAGQGEQYDPRGDGRRMREWLMLAPDSRLDWLALAKEALAFTRTAA